MHPRGKGLENNVSTYKKHDSSAVAVLLEPAFQQIDQRNGEPSMLLGVGHCASRQRWPHNRTDLRAMFRYTML